jgi:hypothetical protein
MSTPNPVPPTTLAGAAAPWYTSSVQKAQIVSIVSALVALSPKAGKLIGVNTPAEAAVWVETVFGFITLVAPILGSIWRARSKLQPLTLTKGNAEVHPATLAAEAVAAAAPPVFVPPVSGGPHVPSPQSSLPTVEFATSTPAAAPAALSGGSTPPHPL